jgi:hypothetical protein
MLSFRDAVLGTLVGGDLGVLRRTLARLFG